MSNPNVINNKLITKDEFITLLGAVITSIEDRELYTEVVQKDLMIEEIQSVMSRIEDGEMFDDVDMLYTAQCVQITDDIAASLRLPEECEDLPGDDD